MHQHRFLHGAPPSRPSGDFSRRLRFSLHWDGPLLAGVLFLAAGGLAILYSAGDQSLPLLEQQSLRLGIAFLIMLLVAQIPPHRYRQWAPGLYGTALLLLVAVLAAGVIGKGAQRWLDLGLLRFQPSELMKLALPMALARYLGDRPLPPTTRELALATLLIAIPALLIARQPDLGTAIITVAAGLFVLFLAGMRVRLILLALGLIALGLPVAWHFLHPYQQARVLTFLNPEREPLGAGYHIIQSKIAIGSGGLWGKGWLNGTQSRLQFLPEHATDFIFAVCGEEFGLLGCLGLLGLFVFLAGRSLFISHRATDAFGRLLGGSLALTFFISFFVNIGMVTGLLPVVGLPLPLVSYGGTSLLTLMTGFGIMMSIYAHRHP